LLLLIVLVGVAALLAAGALIFIGKTGGTPGGALADQRNPAVVVDSWWSGDFAGASHKDQAWMYEDRLMAQFALNPRCHGANAQDCLGLPPTEH
jgi:hypothetical protein